MRTLLPLVVGSMVAALGSRAEAEPAVLYVPEVDVELQPTGLGPCSGMGGQENSALGCTFVPMATVSPAYPGGLELRASLAAALDAYDVHLATQRPPTYLPYTMLLATDDPQPESQSFTCVRTGVHCGARKRNAIVFVFGPTMNCPTSDPALASLYGFGRASGLEGVDEPLDAMFYVPDYGMGTGSFVDACSTIVNQIGFDPMGEVIPLPLECTSLDHPSCPAGEQNGRADLLEAYGARVVDLDPPVASNIVPGDGAVIRPGNDVVLDVDFSDADPVLGARWSVFSPALESAGVPDGMLDICTNDVCQIEWEDAIPLKATDSDWDLSLSGLPEGEYEVTLEASDFHGNVMEPVVFTVVVGEVVPPSTTTDGPSDTGDATTSDPSSTTGPTTGDPLDDSGGGSLEGTGTGAGSSGPMQDDGLIDNGCACRGTGAPAHPGTGGLLLMLLGALRLRRRCA
ncbi:MAG: hypothetical protein AB1Z98_31270 [Nannocystaceae bacterium]